MSYIRYILSVPLLIAMILITWLTAWFWAALSVVFGIKTLPRPFDLLHTSDNTLDGGQDDLGWPKVKGLALVVQRMQWMMRNPAWGFASKVLGVKSYGTKVVTTYKTEGLSWGVEQNQTHKYKLVTAEGKEYFGYRATRKIAGKNLKIWFGWNVVDYDGEYYSLRFEFQPDAVND